MSEEQMNDSTFSRLFIIMIIVMTVLTAVIMVLASFAASDVNAELDARSDVENSASIESRIAPVGQFATEVAEAGPVAAPITLTGADAYASCAACHTAGIVGAPKLGDPAAWSIRIGQGVETLYDHAINGFQGNAGMMPAKGGNVALSDDSVKAAVDYMLQQSR
ncbi:MAG: cytochrome c5 [Arenicella sp.]|jgi:cytochrome c5